MRKAGRGVPGLVGEHIRRINVNLTCEVFEDVIVVHAPEEVAGEQAGVFEGYVAALEQRKVVLDLDGTELLDSRGLSVLLDLHDQLRQQNGEIKIAVTNGTNRKILEITRIDHQLEVFESVVDAVRSFHG